MKSSNSLIFAISGLFLSSIAYAECLPLQGTVQTQFISPSEQIGNINFTSSMPFAFKKAFGQFIIQGGVKGEIVGQDIDAGKIYLNHQLGFPGIGSLRSSNDTAQFTSTEDAEGNIGVYEDVYIQPTNDSYSGAFGKWNFTEMVAIGTVNFTTGFNSFTIKGKICRK